MRVTVYLDRKANSASVTVGELDLADATTVAGLDSTADPDGYLAAAAIRAAVAALNDSLAAASRSDGSLDAELAEKQAEVDRIKASRPVLSEAEPVR